MKTAKTLTVKDLRRAIKKLKEIDNKFPQPVWVDNEWFYQSEMAKLSGFECTKEEIELAKLQDNGFIKMARGVELYLTKIIPVANP
jgi:hypothetical protein